MTEAVNIDHLKPLKENGFLGETKKNNVFRVIDAYEAKIARKMDNGYILIVYSAGGVKEFFADKGQFYLFKEKDLVAGKWVACIIYQDKKIERGLLICPIVTYTLNQFKSMLNTGGI